MRIGGEERAVVLDGECGDPGVVARDPLAGPFEVVEDVGEVLAGLEIDVQGRTAGGEGFDFGGFSLRLFTTADAEVQFAKCNGWKEDIR